MDAPRNDSNQQPKQKCCEMLDNASWRISQLIAFRLKIRLLIWLRLDLRGEIIMDDEIKKNKGNKNILQNISQMKSLGKS